MQSAEVFHKKEVEYKKEIEKLNETCTKLKGELEAHEANQYDQEVRIRDLKSQLKELNDIEDKLQLANRNARVLEEENSTLLMKMKTGSTRHNSGTPPQVEAMKLISENNTFRTEIQELRASINKANQREHQLEQKYKNLLELQEKSEAQIASLKKQISDMNEQLREEKQGWEIAKVCETERARSVQDYEDLLLSVRRYDGSLHHRENRDIKERGNEHQLQQYLLKEDIAELEQKLHLSEESFRAKEREWRKLEATLRGEIMLLKGNKDHNNKEVYRAFQDQLKSFKQEVTSFRGEKKSGRIIAKIPIEGSSLDDGEERINELEANLKSKDNKIEALEAMNFHVSKKNEEIVVENEALREEIEQLQNKNASIEDRANECEIRTKELEVILASVQKDAVILKNVEIDKVKGNSDFTDAEKKKILEENKKLHSSLLRYEAEIADLKALCDQQVALLETRKGEQRHHAVESNQPNEPPRPRAASKSNLKNFPCLDSLQEYPELGLKENEQSWRTKNATDPFVVSKLLKDKMDSVDDVMRVLETTWAEEEEAKRNIKKLSRYSVDLASMLGNADHRTKDEHLNRYIQSLEDNEKKQEKNIQRLQTEKDLLSDEFGELKYDSRVKDSRIRELQSRINLLEHHFSGDDLNIRKQSDTSKDGVMESRVQRLEEAIAKKGTIFDDKLAKNKDRRVQELTEQLTMMKKENDGLWRKLVDVKDERQEGHGHLSSRQASRTPRGSARCRSMEHMVYSRPSTQVSEERKRTVIADGAHLAVTIVQLSDVMRNGRPITEPGFIIIKVKSVKEKYKTSVKELSSVVRFDETFVFYLAQPDEDVITLHIFYKARSSSREFHIGDACFTMAMLYRGVPRHRNALVVQNPGTKNARRAAQVEVIMQSDDFGKMVAPTDAELEDEELRFNELLRRIEVSSPENLHRVDVLMTSSENQWL